MKNNFTTESQRKPKPGKNKIVFLRVSVVKKNYFFAPTGSCFKWASTASLAALSVLSQVKSGSLRPKCPYAAVLR